MLYYILSNLALIFLWFAQQFRRNGAAGTSSQPLRPNEDGSHHLQEYTYKKITACDVCSQILRGKSWRMRIYKTPPPLIILKHTSRSFWHRSHTSGITLPHLQTERSWRLRISTAPLPAEAEATAATEEHIGAGEPRRCRGRKWVLNVANVDCRNIHCYCCTNICLTVAGVIKGRFIIVRKTVYLWMSWQKLIQQ